MRSLAVDIQLRDLQIVLAQSTSPGRRSIGDVRSFTRTRPDGSERHVVAIGEPVAGHVHRRHRELRIDLLGAVLVAQAHVRHFQRGDQVVERLVRLVRIGQRTRQVVAALLVHEVVHVHALDAARLDDVAAAQQIGQAEIDLRPRDRGEHRRVGKSTERTRMFFRSRDAFSRL